MEGCCLLTILLPIVCWARFLITPRNTSQWHYPKLAGPSHISYKCRICLTDLPLGQFYGDIFSIEIPSSQMTPAVSSSQINYTAVSINIFALVLMYISHTFLFLFSFIVIAENLMLQTMSWGHSEKKSTQSHTACAFTVGNCLPSSFGAWFCKACVCYHAATNACAECPSEGTDILSSGPTSLPALLQHISRALARYCCALDLTS